MDAAPGCDNLAAKPLIGPASPQVSALAPVNGLDGGPAVLDPDHGATVLKPADGHQPSMATARINSQSR